MLPVVKFTHVDLLEVKYDGPIPRAALELARALDAAETPKGLKPKLRRAPRRSAGALVHRMARVMIRRCTDGDGACTEADLIAAGFGTVEIAQHAPAARRLAERYFDREVA